ncbi:MAG: hypothetical protein IJ462_00280 [Clostridia bacterium]|nr:hypothetical protein [Clostridia bacterium]
MNFDELYKKYKDGTASKKQRTMVEAEIQKSKRVLEMIDEDNGIEVTIEPADEETVRKAKRSFNIKTTVKTVVITLICIIVVSAIAFGAFFGTAFLSANNSRVITEEQAIEEAKLLIAEHIGNVESKDIIISEIETELDIGSKITDSIYVYEIKLICNECKYEVEVSSKTGYAVITDKDTISSQSKENRKTK